MYAKLTTKIPLLVYSHKFVCVCVYVCACVHVCMCACVKERKREREREHVWEYVHLQPDLSVCKHVCV